MKNKLTFAGAAASIVTMGFLVSAVPAFAASAVLLSHAGIGQKASDMTNFGIAMCNNGTQATAGAVPFQVKANGKTVNASASGPLAAGACQYTYVAYSSFGMTAGSSYSVTVVLDPNHVVTTNVAAPANYMLTAPGNATLSVAPGSSVGQVLGASITSADQQSQLAQLVSLEAILQQLLAQLAAKGK